MGNSVVLRPWRPKTTTFSEPLPIASEIMTPPVNAGKIACTLTPVTPDRFRELAHLHLSEGRYSDATELVSRLAKRPGWEARADLILGQIKLAQDDPAGAAVCLGRALMLDPTAREDTEPPSFYHKLLARALLRTEQPAEAASQLRTVLDSGSDPEASWLLSRAYLQSGSLNQATAALERGDSYRDEHSTVPEPAMFVGSARCAHAIPQSTRRNSPACTR